MAKVDKTQSQENTGLTIAGGEAVAFDASKMKLKQRLVMPTISIKNMKEGDTLAFRAEDEIRYTDQVDEKTGELKVDKDGNPEKLPLLVITTSDGRVGQLVLTAIPYRAFKQAAESAPLKGRYFAMRRGASLGTGKANLWEVVEVEV